MNAMLNELEQWNQLDLHWQHAKADAESAQMDLDYKMYMHLATKCASPAPSVEEQAALDELIEAEGEIRGDMDQFISTRLVK